MESLKRALEQIGRLWANLTATQRVIVGALAAGLVVVFVWGSTGATDTWVRVAGAELDATSRRNIIHQLQEHNQKCEVRGSEILVPKADADRVVLELAGDGAMSDESIWKFLDLTDPFGDPKQKDLRYKRALEQKLSSMIRSVEIVRNASVVITPGSESNRLGVEPARAKAAVQVELHRGRELSSQNVLAIANLVARAVPGLDPEQVVICDNKLNSYSIPRKDSGIGTAVDRREHEKAMEAELTRTITDAFRGAKVAVHVTTRSKSTLTEIDQLTNPQAAHEEESKVVEKGVGSAAAPSLKGEGQTPGGDGGRTEQNFKVDRVFGRKKTREEDPAGTIERVTIGVLIPVEVGPDAKELAEEEKKLPAIRKWVEALSGGIENEVSVEMVAMKRPEPLPAESAPEAAAGWFAIHWGNIVLGLLVVAGVLVLFLVVRGALARDTVEDLELLTSELSGERAPGAPPSGEGDATHLKQGLQEMVGRSPGAVAASLKSFMSGR
jgi:flagellar M-ring protein FliF